MQIALRGATEREVVVQVHHPPGPPVELSHFPHDYCTSIRKSLRECRWKCKFGTLSISAAEPPPLNTWTRELRPSIIAVLMLAFIPSRDYPCGLEPYKPSDWRYVVKYHLRSRTFFSTRVLTRIPTRRAAALDPHMQFEDRKFAFQEREVGTLTWSQVCHCCPTLQRHSDGAVRRIVSSNSAEESGRCRWTSTLTVPIVAIKSLLPTFFNQLSARQYAVVLKLSVKGLRHAPLELVLPLQVFNYPETGMTSEGEGRREYRDETAEEGISVLERSLGGSQQEELGQVELPPYDR